MAVSDLTNTTWEIKNWPTITTSTDNTYNINFTANNISYTAFRLRNNGDYNYIYYNTTKVFDSDLGSWGDYANYRTITITGGTDVTNATLITWLEANATQQVAPTGKTQLGTRTITKKMLGTREITKEVVNGVVVYEKQAPSGGTISLRGVGHQSEQADSYYSYIKINEAPATAQDYDYMITGRGYVNSKTQTQITQPVILEGANVAYLWCDYNADFTCQYKVDNGSYQDLTPFSSPTILTLTNDIELTLTGWRD